jgi:hypothetical protein
MIQKRFHFSREIRDQGSGIRAGLRESKSRGRIPGVHDATSQEAGGKTPRLFTVILPFGLILFPEAKRSGPPKRRRQNLAVLAGVSES